ncbi:hypothetical protein [Singulisphaera sp. PoT]|uniref:hypothetical protein n=1 Tax=Singulisphaera sp. PoT TaxID=3411797 RepID=UPI003BF59572
MPRQSPKPSTPADAIHIAQGDFPSPDARAAISLPDALTLGPCHADPEHHGVLRSEYWHSFKRELEHLSSSKPRRNRKPTAGSTPEIFTARQLLEALANHPESMPIVLWTSPNPGERLAFWWMVDALDRGKIPITRCWVADSWFPKDGPDALLSYHAHPLEMIQDAFEDLQPLTRPQLHNAVRLWSSFTNSSPLTLDQSRRSGTLEPADAQVISELFRWGLPRIIDGEGSYLRLSEFDQLLLGHLNDREWVRPVDVLARAMHDARTRQAIAHYGDLIFAQRLGAWARHQPEAPSLFSKAIPKAANHNTSVAYRLTAKGLRIVESGLLSEEEAPEFHVGGCRVYQGFPPWARHIAENDWRVEAWE